MKVVSAQEMARIEKLAVDAGASEEIFMETAGNLVANRIRYLIAKHHLQPKIALLLGKGNNAGDALVAGRLLLETNCEVFALAINPKEACSLLAKQQWKRFIDKGGKIHFAFENIDFLDAEILVDGIFGIGFKGELEGLAKEVIAKANKSQKIILSIDVPSGINGTTGIANEAIKADETLSLGLPKIGCFLEKAWIYTGNVCVRNFGLDQKYLEEAQADFQLLEINDVVNFLPTITRTRHKYEAGYVLGLGGSPGMPGAPLLASLAAFRTGAGIVRLFHPKIMVSEFLSAPLELIRVGYENCDPIFQEMSRASACFIGPGMGLSDQALDVLKNILPRIIKPCVIDAEALTLIGRHDLSLPKQAILTPHHGEMKRLLGQIDNIPMDQFLALCRSYAEKKEITLILKGAPTWIFSCKEIPVISPFGDPGMATAGAGDVLTGMIAALLAQGLSPQKAAILGVVIHGLSGENAAKQLSSYSCLASDIIHNIPKIFLYLLALKKSGEKNLKKP